MKRKRVGRPRGESAAASKVANERFARWQRRHLRGAVAQDQLLDPLLADPLGLLYVAEYITEEQYQSGVAYREIARRYRVLNGLPSGLPKLMGVKGVSHFEAEDEIVRAVKVRYLAYRTAILRSGGKEAIAAVHGICAMERMIQESELEKLRDGLSAIVSRKHKQTRKSLTGSRVIEVK